MFKVPECKIEDNEYVFDIETAYTDETEKEVYAYLICFRNINDINDRKEFSYKPGDDKQPMFKFLDYIFSLPYKTVVIYAHNCKFDFSYVRDYLYSMMLTILIV